MAAKFATLASKRGYVAIAAVVAAVLGAKTGVTVGFWDGPH